MVRLKIIQQFSLQLGKRSLVRMIDCFGGNVPEMLYITDNKIKSMKTDANFSPYSTLRMNWSNIEKWRKLPKIGTRVLLSMLKYCAKFKKI
jgi:hypothetical protein